MAARGKAILHVIDSEPEQVVQAVWGKPSLVMADLLQTRLNVIMVAPA